MKGLIVKTTNTQVLKKTSTQTRTKMLLNVKNVERKSLTKVLIGGAVDVDMVCVLFVGLDSR